MDGVSRDEFTGREKLCDERFSRDLKSIGTLEESMSALTQLVTQLAEIVKTTVSSTADQESRLRALEGKGGKRWEALVGEVVKMVAVAAVTYLLAKQ